MSIYNIILIVFIIAFVVLLIFLGISDARKGIPFGDKDDEKPF